MRNRKPILIGLSGTVGLFLIYILILTLVNSYNHALEQLAGVWYWIIILVIGFGVQLGLYSHIKINSWVKTGGATAEVAASGGVSTASMIACCAHHLVDILPVIGLSAAAVFLVRYQLPFILIGIFSNLVGIIMMLSVIQKHGLYSGKKILPKLFAYDIPRVRNIIVFASLIIVSISFLFVAIKTPALNRGADEMVSLDLPARTDNRNSVSLEVKPLDFVFNDPVRFSVSINTHQGNLDFDFTRISFLEDAQGNIYKPLDWEGSPPGGHHRFGVLRFPGLNGKTKSIRLIIRDVYGIPERVFEWKLI